MAGTLNRIVGVNHSKGHYRVAELDDGSVRKGIVLGRRLKPYASREQGAAERFRKVLEDLEEEQVSDMDSLEGELEPNFKIVIPLHRRRSVQEGSSEGYGEAEGAEG